MKPIPFETDVGTLAVFDPKVLLHRMRQPKTWWREGGILDVPEILEGKAAIFPIGAEGSYGVRLALDAALTEAEKAFSVGAVPGLGVAVTSGDLFVGAAERLPGDGVGDRVVQIPGTGHFLQVPAGEYDVTVHVIDWRTKKDFFDEDGEPLPTAPADFVVALAKRERPYDAPMELKPLLALVPKHLAKASALRVPTIVRRTGSPGPRVGSPARSHAPAVPIVEEPPPPPSFGTFELPLVRRAFKDVLRADDYRDPDPAMVGGTVVLRPRDTTLQSKEIPVEDLLVKVTRLREQMRVLEQKINAHEKLEDEEKLVLDAHVTSVYDALARINSAVGRARE
jgi:hypothetical protein